MRYGALLGWGIVLYSIMFTGWVGVTIYQPLIGYAGYTIQATVLLLMSLIIGSQLRLPHWSDILPYSFGWALMAVFFDAIFAVPFVGWEVYTNWMVLVGYVLIVVVPLCAPAYIAWRARRTTVL